MTLFNIVSEKMVKLLMKIAGVGILSLIFLMLTLTSFSQGFGVKNKIYIIGQITNNLNGGPIKNHEILICSDSTYNPGFIYHTKLYTDVEGYFYDTITTYVNKGALLISTFDYLDVNHDTTVYFRFNWIEENILFPNLILPVEPPQIIYQANFYYLKNPSGQNIMEYQFFDISNSADIVMREWNFGDGTFSTEANPVHKFTANGLYKVKLTVTIQPTPNSIPFISSMVKIINITGKNYFVLGGHVMAGYFPIDHGKAFLYKIESNDVVLIDTAIFNDTLGYYLFYQLIEGQYIVKADLSPNSVLFNQFMTTYYSNKPVWTEADTIFHFNDYFDYDIAMIPVTQVYTGAGKISGSITYGNDPETNKSFPAINVEILLLNENNEPLICCHSCENGEFSFNELEFGKYKIHPEITGKYTFPVEVTINEINPETNYVIITIGTYTVSGSVSAITENDWQNMVGSPYPNPASGYINLDFNLTENSNITISLYNNTGQLIQESDQFLYFGKSFLHFNIEGLNPGIYFIKVKSGDKEIVRKFIK